MSIEVLETYCSGDAPWVARPLVYTSASLCSIEASPALRRAHIRWEGTA